jgi:uncharacterized phage protein (TIGR02220 family)
MMNYNEVKELAEKYAEYCISVRNNQMLPMDFDEFYEKYQLGKNQMIDPLIDEVINFLNTTCKTYGKRGFKVWGKKIRSVIRQKFKEGFDTNDFYDVIRVKSVWLGDKNMHKYFRPITLFGNKFEDYLNETTQPLDKTTDDKFTNAYNEALNDNF